MVEPAAREIVPIHGEYVGQTEAYLYVEIRARVNGFLEERLFTEGRPIKEGELLYRVDARPYQARIDRITARLESDKTALAKAKRDRDRLEPLYAQNAVSQLDLDNATSAVEQAAAAVAATQAELEEARLELDYTEIRAPISGLIGESRVDIGALVGPQGESFLTTIAKVDPIHVRFSVTGGEYLEYRRQLRARPELAAAVGAVDAVGILLPDGTEYEHKGRLNFTDPRIDERTGTFTVRAEVPNPDRLLLPGQFLRVDLLKDTLPDAITIPQRAIQTSQGGAFVWVVLDDGIAERRFIVTSQRLRNRIIVDQGLAANELVVVEGIQKLRPGLAVEALDSIEEFEKRADELASEAVGAE